MDAREVVTKYESHIRKACLVICRRKGVLQGEEDDFVQSVFDKLLDPDANVIKPFMGKSKITTYLNVVIANHLRDCLDKQFGRFAVSAKAQNMGPLAVLVERLHYRDGLPIDEVLNILRSTGYPDTTRAKLSEIVHKLPIRKPGRRFENVDSIEPPTSNDLADRRVLHDERAERFERARLALRRCLEQCASEDQLLLKLRFSDGRRISEIARMLNYKQKPLYSRMTKLQKDLRTCLEAAGESSAILDDIE